MGALASVLPFLANLKKSIPDFSGMTSDDVSLGDNMNAPSKIPTDPQMLPSPQGPPAPQETMPQPPPDMTLGAGQQQQDLSGLGAGQDAKPKLSKGTQLMMLLKGGLMGGLQGMEANAQTYAATGRNAGFGGGVAGGMQIPNFMRQYQQNQLAQQQAQTELLKQQAQEINVPGYGNMPAGLAKVLFPSLIRGQATTQAATIGAGGRTGAAQISANARIQAAQMGLGPIADVPQDLQDQFGLPPQLPLKMLNTAESAANKPLTTVQGAGGPAVVNKQTKQTTSLGLGAPALARPVLVADPNNPGNVTYQSAGQAIGQGAMSPQSGVSQGARAVTKSAIAGPIGNEINAFNTALAHADLLQKAAGALNNGDVQALNGMKNSFANAFGSAGPVTAQTIADAYTREINKMVSGNHITDSEIAAIGKTIDPNKQNMGQIQSVLGAYKALAASKLQQRQNQVTQGQQGKANFPNQFTVTDPAGGVHTFKDQASADAFKKAIGIQ